MNLSELTAISPIDGRYRSKTGKLADYFSEYALIRYRIKVEVEYFIYLIESRTPELSGIDHELFFKMRDIYHEFSVEDAKAVKDIEKKINHDVKAVEYYIKNRLEKLGLGKHKEFVHFGLTSQDINNTAVPASIKDWLHEEYLPNIIALKDHISELAKEWKDVPMLAKTHGQPASPTVLGKEMMVFVERLQNQILLLEHISIGAKFGGATGNFNAHYAAYPEIDWITFGNEFVRNRLGLIRQQYTTQIEHYDGLGTLFDNIKRINIILLDFCKDMWQYISMEYFKQQLNKDEVGSSAMPHKVNPIDFENAEGNIGIANAVFEHLTQKLPISRLQRDLTDSTVLRNIGVPAAHTMIALGNIEKGIGKLLINKQKLEQDLEDNWIVVSEAIQTVLRRHNYPQPYEKLKELTRTNEKIGQKQIHDFIDTLEVEGHIKNHLKSFSPHNYLGKTHDY